jgi:hypothetical protein
MRPAPADAPDQGPSAADRRAVGCGVRGARLWVWGRRLIEGCQYLTLDSGFCLLWPEGFLHEEPAPAPAGSRPAGV